MTIKRTLLLAGMALAAVAFAAPAGASAHAPEWYIHTMFGEEKLPGFAELHVEGNQSSKIVGGGMLITGPCEITLEGTVTNEAGMAGGSIIKGKPQEECETSVAGCTVTPKLANFPWKITGVTVTGTTGAEVNGITLTNQYMGTCPVPAQTINAAGTATGIVNSPSTTTFENHPDDLFLEPPLPTLRLDILGEVEIAAPLTLK